MRLKKRPCKRNEEHKPGLALRIGSVGPALPDAVGMFENHTNEQGETLSQFELRRYVRDRVRCSASCRLSALMTHPPLPADDAILSLRDVVRIIGLSQSTIKTLGKRSGSSIP